MQVSLRFFGRNARRPPLVFLFVLALNARIDLLPCASRLPHLNRFFLQGAQGEVTHCTKTGTASGVEFKNVELGVLFHSSQDRAYHAPPPPGCSCRSCDLRRRRRCARRIGTHSPLAPPSPPPRPEAARLGPGSASPSNVLGGQDGLTDEGAAALAVAAATVRPSAGLAAGRNVQGSPPPARLQRRGRLRRRPLPRAVPLPVPFCLDSEPYADPEGESPHARFAPFMHTLINQRPW